MDTQYLAIAIQYYIAGRSATFAHSLPVAGLLFHYALEMLFKFVLVKNAGYSDDQLQKRFGHDLNKLWCEVKGILKDPTLDRFDELVSGLDPFWDLRYPRQGYVISISVFRSQMPAISDMKSEQQYQTSLEEIDEFVSSVLTHRVTPEWIRGLMHGDACEQYKRENKHPFF